MKRLFSLLVAVTFVASAAVCFAADVKAPAAAPAVAPAAAPAPPPIANKAGVKVSEWSAKLADGGEIKSAALAGKPYALVFVNSSCAACRGELEALMNLEFGANIAVYVAAVDVKLERVIATYRDSLKVTFPILDDSKFQVAKVFGIGFTPASVIVDGSGKVEAWAAGYTEETKAGILKNFEKYATKKK